MSTVSAQIKNSTERPNLQRLRIQNQGCLELTLPLKENRLFLQYLRDMVLICPQWWSKSEVLIWPGSRYWSGEEKSEHSARRRRLPTCEMQAARFCWSGLEESPRLQLWCTWQRLYPSSKRAWCLHTQLLIPTLTKDPSHVEENWYDFFSNDLMFVDMTFCMTVCTETSSLRWKNAF